MNPLHTSLCDSLNCEYPVIQTAMGWVATPPLVIASIEAGAFAFLAGAVMEIEEIESAVDEIQARTQKSFGLNFHFFQNNAEEIVDLVIKKRIKAVSYGRSPDKELITKLKEAGILCVPTVGALNHALKAESLGADILVVQGSEGGGHTGIIPTDELLPQVVDAVSIPVVAAGGFKDGKGLNKALNLGAVGIAMGTRFMMTTDSPVPSQTLDRYIQATARDIIVTKKFDGLSHRLINNKLIDTVNKSSPIELLIFALKNGFKYKRMTNSSYLDLCRVGFSLFKSDPLKPAQTLMAVNSAVIIQKAMVDGLPEQGAMPSGCVAGEITNLVSCDELVQSIIKEAKSILDNDL
jgi:NAD(P)H-dependent flavin oxidoreductase YrpB (nitropropane dioxygenase family)|tara:strand:+ start:851 stop:1900 length:1050 start_codon:yes stop_codon:yes gene_type:complete